MGTLVTDHKPSEELIAEVRSHKAYRPEINSEREAFMALNGFAPFTYLIRKGKNQEWYFVSFVTDEHTVASEGFWVREHGLYQYRDIYGVEYDLPEYDFIKTNEDLEKVDLTDCTDDPYFLRFYSDLDQLIFEAAMKCPSYKGQTLV